MNSCLFQIAPALIQCIPNPVSQVDDWVPPSMALMAFSGVWTVFLAFEIKVRVRP